MQIPKLRRQVWAFSVVHFPGPLGALGIQDEAWKCKAVESGIKEQKKKEFYLLITYSAHFNFIISFKHLNLRDWGGKQSV